MRLAGKLEVRTAAGDNEWRVLRRLHSTPWAAITGRRSSFPARRFRLSVIRRLSFIFFGDEARIDAAARAASQRSRPSRASSTPPNVIAMHDKPSQALRRGKGTSMWLTLEAVKNGEAHAAVSAGNTGALMAMAKLILRPHGGHRAPGDRGAVADGASSNASCSMSAPTSVRRAQAVRTRADGRGHGARHLPSSSGRLSACSTSASRRSRASRRCARRTPGSRQRPICPSSTKASSRATRSARAPSTSSWSKASPATSRSRRRKAPRARSASISRAR